MFGMRRRDFITLGGAAAAWPVAARAQQADRVRRVCVLMQLVESDPQGPRYVTAFVQGLKDSGWVDGRNLQLEYRWAGDSPDRARTYAAELVRLKPDVMLAQGSIPVLALQRETRTIPIVFTQINDPVESGLVESMARPGGNLTGFFPLEFSAAAKWLAMLREIAPGLIRVAVIMRLDSLTNPGMLRAIEASDDAFASMARERVGGVFVVPSPLATMERAPLVQLALRYRLPTMSASREIVEAGGLMSYGADRDDLVRRTALYIDKILKGAKPADLPVEQASRYQLVINLKTAKALGLDVSPSLLARADEVIE